MTRKNGTKADGNTLRVLVADSTLLTGNLIADALRRDRKLSVANTISDSVVSAVSTWLPHVIILSEALEGIAGRGFEVLTEIRAAFPRLEWSCSSIPRSVRWWWSPFAVGREEYFVEATRSPC